MTADYLTGISDESLIKMYEAIGYKMLKDADYNLSFEELFIISAISRRDLAHKSKFIFDLPKPKEMQSGIERKYMEKTFG